MRPERARNIALAFGAALLLLWSAAATTVIRHTAPPATLRSVTSTDAVAAPLDQSGAATDMVESVLAFVRAITRSLERGDYTGAVIRLLIIVEVLIAALGAVSSITVRGKVKADLVYRIVDVMGALFILIALLLLALTAGSLVTRPPGPTGTSPPVRSLPAPPVAGAAPPQSAGRDVIARPP